MVFGVSLFRLAFRRSSIVKSSPAQSGSNVTVIRRLLTAPSGAILPEPKKVPLSFLKVFLVLGPGIYVGASIAKNGATILEENEIFVPSDDDEED